MKKIYITGLAGMLGGNLAFLLRNRYLVYGCDRIQVKMEKVASTVLDVLDGAQIEQDILRIKPDIVINTVALVNVDACEKQWEDAKKLNTMLPARIVEVCKIIGATMVQISTDAVYAGCKEGLNDEYSETDPVNVYGKTKLEGELPVLEYEKGIVFRTNIYGFNVQNKLSFGEWLLNAMENSEELKMVDDIFFSPILVNDLSEIIVLVCENSIYGLYNACGTGSISKYDFAIYLQKVFNLQDAVIHRLKSHELQWEAARTKNMGMSNEKLKGVLSEKIRTPKESIHFFRELKENGYSDKLKSFGGIVR